MESSRTLPNPVASTSSSSSTSTRREILIRKKRMKTQASSSSTSIHNNNNNGTNSLWKSDSTQQQYSSKLLAALRHVRLTPPSPSAPRRSRVVREAADKVLAVAAKGRTRWSRAILSNKIKPKYLHKRQKVNVSAAGRLPPKPSSTAATRILSLKGKGKELPGVERKVKTLGRLVPGCRKETLPVILEEATDYIPALEMQIRAMRDLLSRLSAAGSGGSAAADGSSAPTPPPSADNEMVE